MCHYITAVLPADANREALAVIAEKYQRKLEPIDNSGVAAKLRPGERYFLTTWAHCDCGTALGALGSEEAKLRKRKTAADAEGERLKKKGWGASKIARWRAQKDEHLAKPLHSPQPTEWTAFIRESLASGYTSAIGLLIHFYSGPVTARLELKGRQAFTAAEVTDEVLGRMQEDVLYDFKAT